MNPRRRQLLLALIMVFTVVITETTTIWILYNTSFNQDRLRLEETAKSQARLIEAIARFGITNSQKNPDEARKDTLSQIRSAHEQYRGFGETGEFTLASLENDHIVFLLNHRHFDLECPKPVPWKSKLAEPMRLALSGKSGTVIAPDYRGVTVLAAHEPVSVVNLGIVAKIDLSEIRAPFIKAGLLICFISLVIIAVGVCVFFKFTEPVLKKLQTMVVQLEKALSEVKTLRGIVPICSYCKKIRNDKGFWDQVEVYVRDHTEADFSHSICPVCMKIHFPDYE